MTRRRPRRATWLAAFGVSALATAAEPASPPAGQPELDAELLEFLGGVDAADDLWTQFLAWLESSDDAKREPPPKAEGETDE